MIKKKKSLLKRSHDHQDHEIKTILYKSTNFVLYKNSANELIWAGIHSNKFEDRDNDILTEESHKRFISKVYAGEVDFPDLWIWHIPMEVGKCNWLAYDDRGFLLSGGKVHKDYEELVTTLVQNTDNMGMSHGMPEDYIEYDDNGYIVDYVSIEVSLLPAEEAANILTMFAT